MARQKSHKGSRGAAHYSAQRQRTERNKNKRAAKTLKQKERYKYGFKIVGSGVNMTVAPCKSGEAGCTSVRSALKKIKAYWTPPAPASTTV
jgi:hypothetical protein